MVKTQRNGDPEMPPEVDKVVKGHGSVTAKVKGAGGLAGWVTESDGEALEQMGLDPDADVADLPRQVVFGEGDTIPLTLAELTWSAFCDSYVAYDADGKEIYRGNGVDRGNKGPSWPGGSV